MTLQWSTPSTPSFYFGDTVRVNATKSLGGGNSVTLTMQAQLSVEGPSPSDETVLDWYGVLRTALEGDGWTADLRFEQPTTVIRAIEDV